MLPDPTTRACLSADEAFNELGIDRTTGYRAIQDGTFPVPVIRVGRLIRVPTAPLRRLLDPSTDGDLYDEEPTTEDVHAQVIPLVPRSESTHECNEAE